MTVKIFDQKFLIILIFVLGFLVRIVGITSSPPALYGDELTIGLDVNSLLHNGTDQLGNTLPLTFKMGAGRPAGYVYGSVPFVAIFGPTELGIRGLSIFSGMGIIFLLYLLGKRLFSERVGLATAFISAFSPWDISLSRAGFEAHFALFLAILGVYFFIKASEKPIFYIFSALSFGMTLHTYPTYKVSLILFLPLMLWFLGAKTIKANKYFYAGMIIVIILGLVALSQTFFSNSEERFSNINIFSRENIKSTIEQKLNYERSESSLPENFKKYFHNKPAEYFKVFAENYLQNFSMDFLVIHGDRNPRHNMATMGELFFAEFLLVLAGILTIWRKNKRLFTYLFFWLLIAPLPTAIVDLPHTLRSSFMLPPLIVLAGVGLAVIWGQRNKLMITILTIIFLVQLAFFVQKLYFLAPGEYANFWSYAAKAASTQAIENKEVFKYIFLSDRIDSIEYAYPLYANIVPSDIISQNKKSTRVGDLEFKKFDNVYIGNIPISKVEEFINSLDGSVLFLDNPKEAASLHNYQTIAEKNQPILVRIIK